MSSTGSARSARYGNEPAECPVNAVGALHRPWHHEHLRLADRHAGDDAVAGELAEQRLGSALEREQDADHLEVDELGFEQVATVHQFAGPEAGRAGCGRLTTSVNPTPAAKAASSSKPAAEWSMMPAEFSRLKNRCPTRPCNSDRRRRTRATG